VRLHELDWGEVLEALPRWEALSPAARAAILSADPGRGVPITVPERVLEELVGARILLRPAARRTHHTLEPAFRTLQAAFQASARLRPLSGRGVLSPAYVRALLSREEARPFAPHVRYRQNVAEKAVAETVSSAEWVRAFLAAASPPAMASWEDRWRGRAEHPRLVFPKVAAALREMVQALSERPGGVPLRELGALVPGSEAETLARALSAAIRYLLLFVSVRGKGMEAVVGLLPAAVARLEPPLPPPTAMADPPAERFELHFRVTDMTEVLVEAATDAIPVRGSDGALYVRALRRIAERLVPHPAWLAESMDYGADVEDEFDEGVTEEEAQALGRVALAAEALVQAKLAKVERAANRYRFMPTKAGRSWLSHSEEARLRELLAIFRGSRHRAPPLWYDSMPGADFFGTRLGFSGGELDLRTPLEQAFLSIPAGGFVPLTDFLLHHARNCNPFFGPEAASVRKQGRWSGVPSTDDGWEAAWRHLLSGFLSARLVPYAGARLAHLGRGRVAVGLTDAGRFLLGGAEDFSLPAAAGGGVLVQPDFEVVFLAPAPRAEVEVGRFAERIGAGVGALFRITRASVLRAAEQGVSADDVLGALRRVSGSAVPANVERQVRDWIGATRSIRIAPAVLVDCPDPETAARVRALGGKKVAEVTPTLLRLEAVGKDRAALVKKLRERGIFVAAG
jgi:hypothetical protein